MNEAVPLETWRETVRPEWCDYNGHMNLAYFVLIFDYATDAFYPMVGLGEDYRTETGCSTFTVETHTTYLAELKEGVAVRCTTQLLDFDEKRVHYFHWMYHADEGFLSATIELMAVHVDLAGRRVVPMPDDVQQRLATLLEVHRALPQPEQVGHTIGIRRKG